AFDRWIDAGGAMMPEMPPLGEASTASNGRSSGSRRCGLVVDALFGIGTSRRIEGMYAEWIAAINRADCPVLAIDVPSGLDADTGASNGPCVRATDTATFIALKTGLLTGPGVDAAGRVTLHDLGIDPGNGARNG